MDRGDFEEAVPFLDKSIAADPKFFSAFYHRSFIYANLQQYEKALSDIKAAIALKPDNAAFRIIECDYLVKLKRFEEAQVLIESCLKTDLTNSELYMMQAISLKEQNKDGYCNALKNAIKFGNADADELLNQWCK
jgi:predicted Zn-dependent protease